jgi:hypothetical protein
MYRSAIRKVCGVKHYGGKMVLKTGRLEPAAAGAIEAN